MGATSDDESETDTAGSAKPRVALDELQRGILRTCATLVRPGGELVFAVCTLTRVEGAGMLEWFLRETAGAFTAADASAERVSIERLRPSLITLRPDRDETDGFVLWRVRRNDNRG